MTMKKHKRSARFVEEKNGSSFLPRNFGDDEYFGKYDEVSDDEYDAVDEESDDDEHDAVDEESSDGEYDAVDVESSSDDDSIDSERIPGRGLKKCKLTMRQPQQMIKKLLCEEGRLYWVWCTAVSVCPVESLDWWN